MNAVITGQPPQVGYEQDFHAWTQQQAELVRARRFEALDIDNLAEEIESMGGEVLSAIESYTRQILVHLALLRHSPAVDPRAHWSDEIGNFRAEIEQRLDRSPSLRPRMAGVVHAEWRRACRLARRKLARDGVAELPAECPFTLAQVLDYDYLPDRQP